MTGRFADRVVIVTGGGQGIGREIALAFGREGAHVVLAARSREAMEDVAERLRAMGVRAHVCVSDVASEESVRAMVATALERERHVDVLVNNSGIAGPAALVRDVKAEDWNRTLDVNLTGAFFCAKHVSAGMINRKSGAIVNIGSIASRIGYALRAAYAASKWGMLGLSHSLAAELGPYGIRVNAVLPGSTEGERINRVITSRAQAEGKSLDEVRDWYVKDIPLGRMVTPQEVASAVLFLASDEASGVNGQVVNVDGGMRMQ